MPSKTALTALTLLYARDLQADGILVNAVNPGFVATDLNNNMGVRTPEQGAAAAVRMATIPADGPTGTFTDDEGNAVPWRAANGPPPRSRGGAGRLVGAGFDQTRDARLAEQDPAR